MTKTNWYLDRLRDILHREDSVNWIYRGLHAKIPCTRRNATFCLDYLSFIKPGRRLRRAEIATLLGYKCPEALLAAIQALSDDHLIHYPGGPREDKP